MPVSLPSLSPPDPQAWRGSEGTQYMVVPRTMTQAMLKVADNQLEIFKILADSIDFNRNEILTLGQSFYSDVPITA